MKVCILYDSPNDNGSLDKHTATVLLKDVQIEHLHKVLSELSEITIKDFARLASISTMQGDDNEHIEKAIYQMCKHSSIQTE